MESSRPNAEHRPRSDDLVAPGLIALAVLVAMGLGSGWLIYACFGPT